MLRTRFLTLLLTLGAAYHAQAAVRLTAIQIISTDTAGKIQGVGAHRFRTVNHGGQPGIFVVEGEDLDGAIINGPTLAQNPLNISLSAGTHTYTVFVEKSNSSFWTTYTLSMHFDDSSAPQISAITSLNTNANFFPPMDVNPGFTENLQGYGIPSPKTLEYKSGLTQVKLAGFNFNTPTLYQKDRVTPAEVKSDGTFDYVGQFTIEVSAPPEISAGGVVNAASYSPKVAPGSLFSIFGTSLATAQVNAPSVPLPVSLGGTSVTIGGKAAPLVFVSPGQINAQVPYEVQPGQSIPVVVTVNGTASPVANVTVIAAAPGIFQYGTKRAVVQNANYTINASENGAPADSYVVVYLTGAGDLDNPVPTGQAAGSTPLSRTRGAVTATINNVNAEVAFAGLTPNFIGLMQVNLKVPPMLPGNYSLVIGINGEKSNSATITVK